MAAIVKILDLCVVDVELPSLLSELDVHMFECTLRNNWNFIF